MWFQVAACCWLALCLLCLVALTRAAAASRTRSRPVAMVSLPDLVSADLAACLLPMSASFVVIRAVVVLDVALPTAAAFALQSVMRFWSYAYVIYLTAAATAQLCLVCAGTTVISERATDESVRSAVRASVAVTSAGLTAAFAPASVRSAMHSYLTRRPLPAVRDERAIAVQVVLILLALLSNLVLKVAVVLQRRKTDLVLFGKSANFAAASRRRRRPLAVALVTVGVLLVASMVVGGRATVAGTYADQRLGFFFATGVLCVGLPLGHLLSDKRGRRYLAKKMGWSKWGGGMTKVAPAMF